MFIGETHVNVHMTDYLSRYIVSHVCPGHVAYTCTRQS